MGAGNEKMKSALCSEHHSEQRLLSNAFKNVHLFKIEAVEKLIVLAL